MLPAHITKTPRETAAKLLSDWLVEYAHHPLLVLLSGGSALSPLDFVVIPAQLNLTLGVLDERFSADSEVNNFLQLSETAFFIQAKERGARVLSSVPGEGESLEDFSRRFEENIRGWQKKNPNGVILATAGIGSDGHTAGILPYPEDEGLFKKLFLETKNYAVGYEVSSDRNQYTRRVTVTIPFLLTQVKRILVYVVGKEKAHLLKKLHVAATPDHSFPMMLFMRTAGAEFITDRPVVL